MLIGSSLLTSNTTTLAAYDPTGLTLGTTIYLSASQTEYRLTATGSPSVGAVAALGYAGLYWEPITFASGTVESVTGTGVDNTDPANPVIVLTDTISPAMLTEQAANTYLANITGSTANPTHASRAAVNAHLRAGATTTTTLGGVGTNIEVSGLDGDNDGDYIIYFHLIGAGTTGVPLLQFNGASTNLYSHWVSMTGASTVAGGRDTGNVALGASLGVGQQMSGWGFIRSRTAPSAWRSGFLEINIEPGPAAYSTKLLYLDAATNITSLRVNAATNSLAANSFLTVIKQYNPS